MNRYRSVFFARYPRYYEGYTSSQRYNLLGFSDGCDDYPVIVRFCALVMIVVRFQRRLE